MAYQRPRCLTAQERLASDTRRMEMSEELLQSPRKGSNREGYRYHPSKWGYRGWPSGDWYHGRGRRRGYHPRRFGYYGSWRPSPGYNPFELTAPGGWTYNWS